MCYSYVAMKENIMFSIAESRELFDETFMDVLLLLDKEIYFYIAI